jgi:hypothetical protein
LAAIASGLLLVPPVGAQRTPSAAANAATNPAPVAPFADPIQTRNLPGHASFALAQTYGQCYAAVLLAKHEVAVRDSSGDTLITEPIPHPLPSTVRAMGETCRARVPTGAATTPELQSAFELAVALGDSTGSVAALDRWLAAPQTLANRGESAFDTRLNRLVTAINRYLDFAITGPMWEFGVAQARACVARLDSMGPEARAARITAQYSILDAETAWRNLVAGRFVDPARVLHDYLALISVYDSASGVVHVSDTYNSTYEGSLFSALIPVMQAQSLIDDSHTKPLLDSLAKNSKGADSAALTWITIRKPGYASVGQPVPKLQAEFWYNTQGDAVWPVPGHVSLLVLGEQSARTARVFRLLAKRYASHGLRITIVNKTKGYWDRSGTETGPRTAAQEAAQDSAYYLGYLKLPVTIAITESQFTRLPTGAYEQTVPVQYERDLVPLAPYLAMILVDANGGRLDTWGMYNQAYMISRLDRLLGVTTP